jgi:CDP-paratose 2-epimerase
MRVLVTGGAGFIGSNLADRLVSDGHQVIVYDALLRQGVERNLAWLEDRHGDKIIAAAADVRDAQSLASIIREVDAVFHLAAQVAVTTSLSDPMRDFEANLRGTLNVLEAARPLGTPVIFASTNKVYGDLSDIALELGDEGYRPRDVGLRNRGIDERRSLDFHTPYGCSKGAADQYVLDYARSFGLPTCVLRMSCIYGPRQFGTEDQGWVAHFLIRTLEDQPITIYGDGRQVRDILYVADAVEAYVAALRRIGRIAGRAFNLGGGLANAVSLLQLLEHIERVCGRRPSVNFAPWRAGDQRYYVSDPHAVQRELGLHKPRDWRTGVADLTEWLAADRGLKLERPYRIETVS